MKKIYLIIILIIISSTSFSQKKKYWSSGGEFILNFARIDNDGNENGNVMRFSAFLHIQAAYNIDFSKSFGIYTGAAIRNVGFIYKHPESEETYKYRTYNFGIPFGIKIGKMTGTFLYAGYEVEFPFNYKEKRFKNEVKQDKFSVWFSNRVVNVAHGPFVGLQLPYGLNLKFKYYLNNFFNKDFVVLDDKNQPTKPYDIDVNLFYISLSFNIFQEKGIYYNMDNVRDN
ncbi:hypothetical protein ACFLRY_00450 [Bacteroidota bacterium]